MKQYYFTKYFFVCILLFSLSKSLIGQYSKLPDQGAVWKVLFEKHDGPNVTWSLDQITYSQDSIINGLTYKFLEGYGGNPLHENFGLLEDTIQKKVFLRFMKISICCVPDSNYLIYDFSMGIGDSMKVERIGLQYPIYWEVIDTGKTLVDGQLRNYLDVYSKGMLGLKFDRWIEGIGSQLLITRPLLPLFGWEIRSELVCFRDSNAGVFYEPLKNVYPNISCAGNLGAVNMEKPKISIYPNPVTDLLTIDLPVNEGPFHYTIWNTYGQKISESKISDKASQIDMMDLEKGSYLLSISNEKSINQFLILKK